MLEQKGQKTPADSAQEEMSKLFNVLDQNRDGFVDWPEVRIGVSKDKGYFSVCLWQTMAATLNIQKHGYEAVKDRSGNGSNVE
jgi:Ca2+-binding EF-hand superfamily protein